MRDDIWGLLYETEAFIRAQDAIAAGFASDVAPHELSEQLEQICLWVMGSDDPEQNARRLVQVGSAFALLATSMYETFAIEVEKSKLMVAGATEDVEPDREAVRRTMLHMLERAAEELRRDFD